ncbi:5-hydroxytryptamine receptor 6 [Tachyglossus aculeatus]|uniref:5-hydroxytryptamine receptor 6 n=1 Tax=Tachyglossus aculeatus TaxID=9261 RepID=UPI0018F73180|nr:5-hydroxytryptamine receptor 6 [Tachyglossus aculeatus]
MPPTLGLGNSSLEAGAPSSGPGGIAGIAGSGWAAALLGLIVALTAAGNALLILLICSQPSLRNTSNYFLASLFMADLMVGLVVMPPALLNALYGRWVLARRLCLLWAAFDVMCCSASILNLCLISLDRYLLILSPLRYKLRMTPRRALALILAAWTLAALASFLPLHMGWHQPGARALNATAADGQCRLTVSLPFVLVASCLTFFLPSVAISFTYCRILLAARKQAVQVASLAATVAGPSDDPWQAPRTPTDNRRLVTKHSRKALKASLTLGILLGMFFVAWLPFFVANLAQAVCDCVPAGLFDILTWLGYFNSTMNPIIYPLFMRDFKRAMAKVLPCPQRAWERQASPISLSARNSHSGPRLGLALKNALTVPGETDSGDSVLQVTDRLLLPKAPGLDPLTPTGADSVNLFDMDPAEQELRLHPLNTPMD